MMETQHTVFTFANIGRSFRPAAAGSGFLRSSFNEFRQLATLRHLFTKGNLHNRYKHSPKARSQPELRCSEKLSQTGCNPVQRNPVSGISWTRIWSPVSACPSNTESLHSFRCVVGTKTSVSHSMRINSITKFARLPSIKPRPHVEVVFCEPIIDT